MYGQRVFESARQLARRHLAHRCFKRTYCRLNELPDAGAVTRRNKVQWRERHEVELEGELAVDRLALIGRNSIPLVDCNDQRATPLESDPKHARILFRNRVVGI